MVSKYGLQIAGQDTEIAKDANKRVVLECGGIELLLRCANMKLWPDVVTPALWNICADTEVQAGVETGTALGDDGILEKLPQMSLIACTQLALRSIGECDDSKGKSLLAAEIEDGRRHKNIVQELLDLADVVKGETWKEMAAELLEKASWSSKSTYLTSSARQAENLHAVSCLSNSDRKIILPHSTRLTRPQIRPKDILSELLTGSGRRLAMTNPECNGDVTRTIAVLLSDAEMQRELIHDDLLELFLEVPNWGSISSGDDERNPGAPRAKAMVQQSLFKTTYDVTALPEFTARFGKGNECPKLVTACIDALRDVSNLRQTKKAANSVPAASACVVLANLTKSTEYALFLVQRKNVHLSLGLILRQREDTVTLFPAIALLDRLAIPPENKTAMFGAGIIYELPRFLTGFDVQPRIQREAVSVIRKIILGHPQHVSGIGLCIPVNAQEHAQDQKPERIQEQSGLLAALNLFRRTTEVETKIEIGRLVIEVCRTLLHSTGGHSERAENAVHQAFGSACDIANPVTYLACNGPSEEVRGEGWFGLAVLSTWEHGRPFVMECLTREEVQKSMDEAMKNGDRTFGQNISLMLTRLHHFPSRLVLPSTREFLEHAASNAGLPPIWPVLALAA